MKQYKLLWHNLQHSDELEKEVNLFSEKGFSVQEMRTHNGVVTILMVKDETVHD